MLYSEKNYLNQPLSRIIFGGAAISGEGGGYGFGAMSEKEAEAIIKSSWESGINIYDTAPIYGFGLSEERLGKFLPEEALVITKGGVDWHDNMRVNMTNEPVVIEKMLNQSLHRLKRDSIDIYMIHWPDKNVDIRRPLEILKKAHDDGKIKKIGLCNTNLEDLKLASEIANIDFLQSELNAFKQEGFSCLGREWKNRFSMSWGTLDKGILTGRVTKERKFSKEDCRSWAPWWNKKEVDEKITRVEKLKPILAAHQLSLTEFALHFNLTYFGIDACLIGFKSKDDLVELTSNLQKNNIRARIEEVLEQWNK
ncbi:MAG: aldo/keto reductase [Bacteriovoracaceae bacterium]